MSRVRLAVPILTLVIAAAISHCGVIAVERASPARSSELPRPTGEFMVGRVTLSIVDTSRREHVPPGGDNRALPVDVWYPAAPSSAPPAPYFDVAAFADAVAAEQLESYLGSI